ncbi:MULTISPECIES: FecCD family ABC transporter permease [Rheinheimera]|uniref:FecCD family ABC transporter permease n=1 Tax=Rheinheimera marina TaxID=1774958 RepID=A0ABV9JK47_9GAMM
MTQKLRWGLLLLALLAVPVCSLLTGPLALSWSALWQAPDPMTATVLWQIRLPRILLAMVAGAGLALCGALLQNCCRNSLADPYLFGVVSGAALGATLHQLVLPHWPGALAFSAFAGSSLAILLVLVISRLGSGQRLETLLLCGVAISFLFSALSSALLYISEPFAANRVMFWLLGSLAQASYADLQLSVPLLLVLLAVSLLFRRQLDALLLTDESARSLGVPVTALRLMLLLGCAALTAVIVACCGGIAFIGLMVPHLVRRLFGLSSIALVLGATGLGAVFLLAVDTLSRSAFPSQELPVGVLTSAIGSVFFFSLVLRQKL